ncbi:MAG: UDP-N-acetylglucosamine 1-carboxyvinyltransferase [Pirellulales bacterium]|nr:UDP-N-acetylglucosamine 1-carboxyvinyltransferase [Pirellulales bacterium]
MQQFTIIGGRPLVGSVAASGAKNAALPILAASILASEPVTVSRMPRVTDVYTMLRLLQSLGAPQSTISACATAGLSDSAVTIDPRTLTRAAPAARYVRRMRASFCVLGPLLARHGRAVVPLPGGCRIGPRPVDLHLRGLAALGADIRVVDGLVIARAARLRGARVSLIGPHGPTVTGTANVLCAAVLARGATIIEGAAIEPEITDLVRFLNSLGARIDGAGTAMLEIRGVEQLGGARHELIADRIEAGTLLAAGLATCGRVTVERIDPNHLSAVLEAFARMGAEIEVSVDRVTVSRRGRIHPINFTARPYPGVPTDLQAQLMALAVLADGTSQIADSVFPERFAHVQQLRRMGAQSTQRANGVTIRGVQQLHGARVVASDLRASAALVLSALAARGTSHVERLHHLDRGYERLEDKLWSLGANIRRESIPSRDVLLAAR